MHIKCVDDTTGWDYKHTDSLDLEFPLTDWNIEKSNKMGEVVQNGGEIH